MSTTNLNLTVPITEITLFANETEENYPLETVDSALPEGQGALKATSKSYIMTPQQNAAHAKGALGHLYACSQKIISPSQRSEKMSLMQLASTLQTGVRTFEKVNSQKQPLLATPQLVEGKQTEKNTPTLINSPQAPLQISSGQNAPVKVSAPTQTSPLPEKSNPSRENRENSSLSSHRWKKEETTEWWDTRYHEKEGRGDHKGKNQDEPQKEEENACGIKKGTRVSPKNNSFNAPFREKRYEKIKRPLLNPPKVGVFALYYILTKMGIHSDGTSNFAQKKEIELLDTETNETHKKRLDELREVIKKEKENAQWGIAAKIFSWIGSLVAIISGIALIMTGAGAVAGAMLICGGLIQITSQILELSGGWKKISELLPGDDSEKKRAVLSWMQIGIGVLCLVLSGAGVLWGGFSNFGETMQTAMRLIGGIGTMGSAVTTLGVSVTSFFYCNRISEVKRYELELAKLKHKRKDLMERVEHGIDRLEQLFEDLARTLEFEEELFRADQMINRG